MKTLAIFLYVFSMFTSVPDTKNTEPQYETIPIINLNVLPLIKMNVNGYETYFLVDSGSSATVLDINRRKKLGFETYELTGSQRVLSTGGGSKFRYVRKAELQLGSVKIKNRITALDITTIVGYIKRKTSYRISGILGTDTMKKYNIIIDYGNEVCRVGIPDGKK